MKRRNVRCRAVGGRRGARGGRRRSAGLWGEPAGRHGAVGRGGRGAAALLASRRRAVLTEAELVLSDLEITVRQVERLHRRSTQDDGPAAREDTGKRHDLAADVSGSARGPVVRALRPRRRRADRLGPPPGHGARPARDRAQRPRAARHRAPRCDPDGGPRPAPVRRGVLAAGRRRWPPCARLTTTTHSDGSEPTALGCTRQASQRRNRPQLPRTGPRVPRHRRPRPNRPEGRHRPSHADRRRPARNRGGPGPRDHRLVRAGHPPRRETGRVALCPAVVAEYATQLARNPALVDALARSAAIDPDARRCIDATTVRDLARP